MNPNTTGSWQIEKHAENFLTDVLKEFYEACPQALAFATDLQKNIAVRLRDIIDHISFNDQNIIPKLINYGWMNKIGRAHV